MKQPRIKQPAPAGDRAVAIGGFLAVLLTGFFGAEPPAQPVEYSAVQCAQQHVASECASR